MAAITHTSEASLFIFAKFNKWLSPSLTSSDAPEPTFWRAKPSLAELKPPKKQT